MAAPNETTWGNTINDYGRVGIYVGITETETQVKVNVQTWFWSKYSVSDTNNSYYYSNNATSATYLIGSISLKTYNDSTAWSTTNQVKLGESTYTYDKSTSAVSRNCAVKLMNVDRVGGTMTHTRSYTIPALEKYTISYNANGGKDAPSNQTKYHGVNLTLSSVKPTRSGYTFVGWGTSASDTSIDYSPNGSYTANASDILYAIWKKTITLTYKGNGGEGVPSSQSATIYNATTSYTFKIPNTVPKFTGHTFLGWVLASNHNSGTYQPGDSITLSSSDTLYAKWKAITYTVTYDANGGSGQPTPQTKGYGDTLKLSTQVPKRAGYKFLGWGESTNEVKYTPGGNYTSNTDITLYAVWEQLGIANINIDGEYKKGRVWINIDGTWKSGLIFINVDGNWKQGGA